MTERAYRVHLNDEIPAAGSGRRRVVVEALGWKWVTIRIPHRINKVRVPRRTWEQLKPEPCP